MQKILKCVGNPKVNCKGNVGILFSFQLLWLLTKILLDLGFEILISQSRDPTHSRICHQYDKKIGSLPSHQLLRFLASITSTRDSNRISQRRVLQTA